MRGKNGDNIYRLVKRGGPVEACTAYMFTCPQCGLDTPHALIDRRHDVVGIVCGHCRMPSIVRYDVFKCHQNRWEDELRDILNSLDNSGDDD